MIVTDDGCRLWSAAAGSGPPVVLVHGGPGLWDMFGDLAGDLPGTVVRWDQRGCGRSEGADGPWTLARAVADLDAVVGSVGPPAALLGHSWGAQLALAYALAHPDRVTRLVYLSGTGLSPDSWRPEFHAAFDRRLDRARLRELEAADPRAAAVLQWGADVADPARAAAIAERMATPWYGVNRALMEDTRAHWDEAAVAAACRDLDLPVLVLEGAEDLRPRWAVDGLAAALPAGTRLTLPGVGHLPWLEAPEQVLPVLRDFLEAGR